MGIDNFEMSMPKTLMSIIGWETILPLSMRFKIESYYKYMFDRFYYNEKQDENSNIDIKVHMDGLGHAAGFDILLQKKTSRYLDGLLSYSFIFAHYLDPEDDGMENPTGIRGKWYYPPFHRFHTLNFVLNIKPFNWMTLTTQTCFASGQPRRKYGEAEMLPVQVENKDGSTVLAEMYLRDSEYSDTLRNWISLPLDVKLSFHNYYTNSKIRWEAYIAVEDTLSYLLQKISPKNSTAINSFTGKETSVPSADFSFIMPSLGFKITY